MAVRRDRREVPRPLLLDVAGAARAWARRHRRRVREAGPRRRVGRPDRLHDRGRGRACLAPGRVDPGRSQPRLPDELGLRGDRDRGQARPPVPPPPRRPPSLQVHLALRLVSRRGDGRHVDRRAAPPRRAVLPDAAGDRERRAADGRGRRRCGGGDPDGDRDGGARNRRRGHRRASRDHPVHDPRRRLLAAGPRDLRRVRRAADRRRDADRLLPERPRAGPSSAGASRPTCSSPRRPSAPGTRPSPR